MVYFSKFTENESNQEGEADQLQSLAITQLARIIKKGKRNNESKEGAKSPGGQQQNKNRTNTVKGIVRFDTFVLQITLQG